MTVIVNYGLGNLQSIQNMILRLGGDVQISNDIQVINQADRLILPGVGAFDTGMENLHRYGLVKPLEDAAFKTKKPILGICLGAQLMLEKSAEGSSKGLSFISGSVDSFKSNFQTNAIDLPVPNMGWRTVISKEQTNHFKLPEDFRFYFVHSYFFQLIEPSHVLYESIYGAQFCAGYKQENLIGVQFHPEKSHKFGFHLMQQFLAYA